MSAAVFDRGEPVWQLAVGLADVAAGREATPDTQYRVASITKTFTAAAVMQLRDAGRVDLGAPLAEYVPELADAPPTVKDVLSHASGLQREEPGAEWEPIAYLSHDELFARLGEAERCSTARRRVPLLEPRLHAARRDRRAHSGEPYTPTSRSGCSPRSASTRRPGSPSQAPRSATTWSPGRDVVHVEAAPDVGRAARRASSGARRPTSRAGRGSSATPTPLCCAGDRPRCSGCRRSPTTQPGSAARASGCCLWRDGDRLFAGHSGGMNGFLSNFAFDLRGSTGAVLLTNASTSLSVEALGVELAARRPTAPRRRPSRGARARRRRASSTACSATGGRRAGSSSSRTATAACRRARLGSTADPAVFERVGPDRYVGVSGRERGEPLRSCATATADR